MKIKMFVSLLAAFFFLHNCYQVNAQNTRRVPPGFAREDVVLYLSLAEKTLYVQPGAEGLISKYFAGEPGKVPKEFIWKGNSATPVKIDVEVTSANVWDLPEPIPGDRITLRNAECDFDGIAMPEGRCEPNEGGGYKQKVPYATGTCHRFELVSSSCTMEWRVVGEYRYYSDTDCKNITKIEQFYGWSCP